MFRNYKESSLFNTLNKGRLSCWWCSYPFEHCPVGAPSSSDPRALIGVFCSWNCCIAHNRARGGVRMMDRHYMIRCLACRLHDIPLSSDIRPAPPKELLLRYGGPLSIEQFRADSQGKRFIENVDDRIFTELRSAHIQAMENWSRPCPHACKNEKKKKKKPESKLQNLPAPSASIAFKPSNTKQLSRPGLNLNRLSSLGVSMHKA